MLPPNKLGPFKNIQVPYQENTVNDVGDAGVRPVGGERHLRSRSWTSQAECLAVHQVSTSAAQPCSQAVDRFSQHGVSKARATAAQAPIEEEDAAQGVNKQTAYMCMHDRPVRSAK